MGRPNVEGATVSEGQQMQLKEAEEECLRGLAYLEWGSGTEDKMCRQR